MTLHVWDRADTAAGSATRRRLLWAGVLVVVAVLVVTAVVVGIRRNAHKGESLDPQNPGREGAQALASVLRDRGVDVQVVRGQQELLDAPVDAGTTVLVTGTGELSDQTAATMVEHVPGAGRLLLVAPGQFLLSALELPVNAAGDAGIPSTTTAGCTVDGLSPGDRVVPAPQTYVATGSGTVGCFAHDGSFELVAIPANGDQPEVVLLGNADLLANSQITQEDHAGVALRLLGRGDRVVWYLPTSLDISDDDTTATSEIPRALGPLVFLSVFGLLALMLWRGRRFGPLVTEPLPAVVKAIETTQSRGRLYRKARDTQRAGGVLRARTTKRLAAYLGLPTGAAPDAVARAAATATGRDPQSVTDLFTAAPPTTEAALVALANDLTDLEKEVRRA
ncbi:DUF4350 domain-containing protein [Phycicoccus sp. Root101]|uniref:DUF4350 domain-containing protein n=1 Tax=Phycicoccus sp. Root101 TaxID=1736421 RepID=UPI00070326E0|nr:DUF4350 domain-containing protein [Phycicoccus sp. Root101]KQU69318.1 hypothetical protein ASC58_05335 [Phycicoccus sp. Root101]